MPEIKFLSTLENLPQARTQIYRLTPPGITRGKLIDTAMAFGVSGNLGRGRFQEDENKYTYLEGQFSVTVYKVSGGLRYQDISRWQIDDGKSNIKYDDKTAIKRAQEIVRKYKLASLKELRVLKVSRLHVGSIELATRKGDERIIDVGIAFQRVIDRIPVDGPGGKIVVYLDQQGEVTGIDRLWRNIKDAYRPVTKLRSPKLAEEDLRRYWSKHTSYQINVNETRFAYFELGWKETQKYLQPVYVMPMTILSASGRSVMKSVHVYEAATNPVGKIMPTPKIQPRLPKRQE